MKNPQPDATIDVRGSMAPVSLLKVGNQLARMARGQTLEVLCGDKNTKSDLLDIMHNAQHSCLDVTAIDDYFKVLIQKTGPDVASRE